MGTHGVPSEWRNKIRLPYIMRPKAHHRQTGLPYLRIIPAVILGYAKRISHFRVGWKGQGDGGSDGGNGGGKREKEKRERERQRAEGERGRRRLTYIHPPNPFLMIKDPRLLAVPRQQRPPPHCAQFLLRCRIAPWGNTETIRALPTSDSRFPRRGYLGGEPVELT